MESSTQDLRVVKTIDIIKNALLTLIPQKSFREITVVEIARTARVNRKTFYNHYTSIEDALLDIEKDYVAEISEQIGQLDPDDLGGAILIYYKFLDFDDPVRQKLLYGSDYEKFFDRLNSDVMTLPFFMRFCKNDEYHDLVLGYLDATAGIYLRWRREPVHKVDLEGLAERAAKLIYAGLASV